MVMIASKQFVTLLKGHRAGPHTLTQARAQTWTQHTDHRMQQAWHVPATQLPVPGSQGRCKKDAEQAPRAQLLLEFYNKEEGPCPSYTQTGTLKLKPLGWY